MATVCSRGLRRAPLLPAAAQLQASVVEEDTEEWQKDPSFAGLERVGGVDLSYIKGDDTRACASLVVLSYPALEVLYEDCRMVAVNAPYVAGFLAFREVPFLVEALQRLQQEQPRLKPQVLLVDGNGLLHPRGFGVACHLGVLTDLPCIGVAKNLLHVDGLAKDELHREQIRSLQREGDSFPLTGTSGRVLGMALRSHNNSSRPLYVSVGHRVSLGTAVRLLRSCCRYRIPEPIRQADMRSREYIRKQLCSPLEVLSSGPESTKKEAEDCIRVVPEGTAGPLFPGSSPPPRLWFCRVQEPSATPGDSRASRVHQATPATACGSGGQADQLLFKDNAQSVFLRVDF